MMMMDDVFLWPRWWRGLVKFVVAQAKVPLKKKQSKSLHHTSYVLRATSYEPPTSTLLRAASASSEFAVSSLHVQGLVHVSSLRFAVCIYGSRKGKGLIKLKEHGTQIDQTRPKINRILSECLAQSAHEMKWPPSSRTNDLGISKAKTRGKPLRL